MNNTFSTEFLKIFTGHNINWHTLYICVCVCVCVYVSESYAHIDVWFFSIIGPYPFYILLLVGQHRGFFHQILPSLSQCDRK